MGTKEEQFYKKHFNNLFKEGDLNDFDSYKNQSPHHFDKCGRYRICIDSLDKNTNLKLSKLHDARIGKLAIEAAFEKKQRWHIEKWHPACKIHCFQSEHEATYEGEEYYEVSGTSTVHEVPSQRF